MFDFIADLFSGRNDIPKVTLDPAQKLEVGWLYR